MKINSLYISSFAGIKDLKLDFCDGLNVIHGNNEDGKTTVMSFIKMMFYGSKNGGSSLAKNIRKKYTPWDNSAMAGSIDFEHGGKKYRLEKEFRASNSTDKTTLYDLQLSEGKSVSSDVGTEFFGLSLSAFERSVFIGQFGFPENDSDAEGEISAKLSNLALTGDENISFDAVNARLQKAKLALMSKSGKAGAYDKNIKTASEYEEKISSLSSQKDQLAEKKAQIAKLETEIFALQKSAQELNNKISSEQDIRNAQKLTRLLELKQELDELNQTLTLSDGTVIDEMYLRKLKFCISKAETATAKVSSKENEIALLNKSIDAGLNPPENATKENSQILGGKIAELNIAISKKTADCENLKSQLYKLEQELPKALNKRKKTNAPLLISGGVCLLLFAVLTVFNIILGVAGIGISLIISVLSFVLKPIDDKPSQKIKEEIEV
ncbi:MAG: AAA family ATPase, partial [Clostridia bacterium]|nr:AAA family ATPase [Clostridia bacterium]